MRKEDGEMSAKEGSGSGSGSVQSDASMTSSPAGTRQSGREPETLHGDGPEAHSDENERQSPSPAAHEETKDDEEESVRLQALTDHSIGLDDSKGEGKEDRGMNGREKLKRHRIEVAGRAWIPEIWGQEELLKDLVDCSAFEASFLPAKIMSAKAALVEEGRRANSSRLRLENRC
ncbi:hypothetical protein BT93_A0494 [Corymbia citriodora subsp. variegata]|nr:hypothetical protein BT93_A0494 [Corymbia citriodora subsp. variegata]